MTNRSLPKTTPALVVAFASASAVAWKIQGESRHHPSSSVGPVSRLLPLPPRLIPFVTLYPFRPNLSLCETARISVEGGGDSVDSSGPSAPSWLRRRVLSLIGIPLPKPRLLTSQDPALKLPSKYIRRRHNDELKMREILERAPAIRSNTEKMKALSQELFEVTYGKGVTAQEREDFLVRYGCTGWNEKVLDLILQVAGSRGIVEIGAGHGQWARALNEAYAAVEQQKTSGTILPGKSRKKQFDYVLAYDDNSNLPLNTHIYNPYTKPHHEYFGNVRILESLEHTVKVLRSWTCRGRVLLLVYPPPTEMATQVVTAYVNAAPEDNNTVIFVGEGRGGANGDDSLFDYFENGEWELLEETNVRRPPGDKGYEKLFVLHRRGAPE